MTDKQVEQFNFMLSVLRRIARDYQTPEQLRANCERQYGLEFKDALEMAYDNIQADAEATIKGVRAIS